MKHACCTPLAIDSFNTEKQLLMQQRRRHSPLPNIPLIVNMDLSNSGLWGILALKTKQGEKHNEY